MRMVADSLPGLKRWTAGLGLKDSAKLLLIRVVVAFPAARRRMSCLQAAGVVRCEARHRAQISRFLARPRWRKLNINSILRQRLREREAADGLVRISHRRHVDQSGRNKRKTPTAPATVKNGCGKGVATANTNTLRRTRHSFTMGLLVTPSGTRIPFCKPYHERASTARRRAWSTAPRPRRQPI